MIPHQIATQIQHSQQTAILDDTLSQSHHDEQDRPPPRKSDICGDNEGRSTSN
jgi:hypothetical protein